ncbi:MAG: carboxypeptidase regulatory-like domain-containing protein [Planctomycetes bacterium]|nr:carboxypeptidase regulatory-like domain-containing protein [Planctomycetota bacterium]
MRPLLVLVLVLAAIGALLFAIFGIDGGTRPTEVAPPVAERPAEPPRRPTALEGGSAPAPDRAPSATRSDDRSVAGGSAAVALDNRLTGLVRNPQGGAVAGAEVILSTLGASELFFVNDPLPDHSKEPRVRTDAEGRYTFVGVQPRDRYTLILTHPEYSRREEPTMPIGEVGAAEMPPITLTPGASLSGRVRNEAGDFVRGATLFLEGFQYQNLGIVAPDRATSVTDAEGTYRFKNVAPGPRYLKVTAPGYATIQIPSLNFEKEETVVRDITLKIGEGILGRVVGPGNVGIPDARVIAIGVSSLQQTGREETVTNANGEFLFESLASGDYNVIANAKGWRMQPKGGGHRVSTNTSNHVIEMLPEATISGRVVETGTGKTVPAFTVRMRVYYGPGTPSAPYNEETFPQSHPNGEFSVPGVPAGEFVVEAWAPGYAPGFSRNFSVEAGRSVSGIEVRLGRGGSISGRVVDAQGAPVARARVSTHDNDWTDDEFTKAIGITYPTTATSAETRTGEDGRFTISGLSPDVYQIQVVAAGYTSFMRRDLRVAEGADAAVGDLRLGRGGIVRGTLYDASGKPLVGGSVELRGDAGDMPRIYKTRTAGDGRFQISNVLPGSYVLLAMRPGGSEANPFAQAGDARNSETRVRVDEGGTTTQDLHLAD